MLTDTLKKLATFAWFLPGFLLWAAFPPMGEGADCLFALAPLLWLARRERKQDVHPFAHGRIRRPQEKARQEPGELQKPFEHVA